jgi:hypothetical protein
VNLEVVTDKKTFSAHYLVDSANPIARPAMPSAEIAVRIRLTNGF